MHINNTHICLNKHMKSKVKQRFDTMYSQFEKQVMLEDGFCTYDLPNMI